MIKRKKQTKIKVSARKIEALKREFGIDLIERSSRVPEGVHKLLLTEKQGIKLSVGCGEHLQEGFVGIDIRDVKNPNYIKHDIEVYPWPLPDECAHIVSAGMVIEHINPAKLGVIRFMDEIWRVTKTGGQLMISTPMAGSPMADTDPGHMRSYTEAFFYYFDPLHQSGFWQVYRPKPWKIKGLMWSKDGLIECVLEKRIVDISYQSEVKK